MPDLLMSQLNSHEVCMPAGKICDLEIPTDNVEISAHFYAKVFDWKIRVRGDGERAFDDATGAVSGAWMLGDHRRVSPGCSFTLWSTAWMRLWTRCLKPAGKQSPREPRLAPAVRRLPRSVVQAET